MNTETIPSTKAPRYNLDPYKEWADREGIPISSGIALDLFEVPLGDWGRYDARGAICHFVGSGDFLNMFVLEIKAGAATAPQQHLYEDIYFVLEGRGITQLEFSDGRKRSFEWGPRSFFAIPLNAKHRHFNASGTQRALLASTTNLPMIMKTFHNERFVFGTDFTFEDRFGRDEYYAGDGDLYLISQGNDFWETNFVPDLSSIRLTQYADRGTGSSNIKFILADGILYAHTSEIAAGTYKKAHRHDEGYFVMTVTGKGYSLLWFEGDDDFTRVDWKYGVVFPPIDNQFHQHFVTSNEPSRYVATGFGSFRYPFLERHRRYAFAERGKKQESSRSVKEGGHQIEYEDQDPRIHQIWLEEMRKAGATPMFSQPGVMRT